MILLQQSFSVRRFHVQDNQRRIVTIAFVMRYLVFGYLINLVVLRMHGKINICSIHANQSLHKIDMTWNSIHIHKNSRLKRTVQHGMNLKRLSPMPQRLILQLIQTTLPQNWRAGIVTQPPPPTLTPIRGIMTLPRQIFKNNNHVKKRLHLLRQTVTNLRFRRQRPPRAKAFRESFRGVGNAHLLQMRNHGHERVHGPVHGTGYAVEYAQVAHCAGAFEGS
mmetsp:Transcript_6851/g.8495  ORF Transcript_6851/g.8495 Transcript_6851/m.8495 type:complete len:221 (+) Transcript_6851:264-926(+)